MKKLSVKFIKENCATQCTFSKCMKYRYALTRTWDAEKANLLWIMLNPSTADESANDPTVDKCMKWAIDWGYGSFTVCNLFAYRETDRNLMLKIGRTGFSIVGINNNYHTIQSAKKAKMIICGWGNEGKFDHRDSRVLKLLSNYNLFAMRINKNGTPGHPLYLKKSTVPRIYRKELIEKVTGRPI